VFILKLKKSLVAISALVLLANISPISPFSAVEANAVSPNSGVTDVASGTFHSCAVVSGGLQCWGANGQGQLGDGTQVAKLVPTVIFPANSGVTAVATGSGYTCAVVYGGVKCWGQNAAYQLGDGSSTRRLSPVQTIPANSGVTAIYAGGGPTCAVVSGGVKCWGQATGHFWGTSNPLAAIKTSPFERIAEGSGVTSVSVDGDNACAVISGGLMCWGGNNSNQLGNGTTNPVSTPTYTVPANSGVTAVGVSGANACVVISGGVKCWGFNDFGQLGAGNTNSTNDQVTAIANNSGAISVAVGQKYACVVISGGVKCWGINTQNQLGNGDTQTQSSPVDTIAASSGVTSVKGYSQTTCAIVAGGVKCWGYNNAGQTGDSRKVNNPTPFTVSNLSVSTLYSVTFDSKSGSSVDAKTFLSGGSVSEPTPPTRSGHTFLGWSAADGGSAVSFPHSPGVDEDVTLYALWEAETYQVTFNSNGGDDVDFDSFVNGGTVAEPFAPTRAGYTFLGWSATDGGSAVSFPYTPIVSDDITLYALWSADSYTVTFHSMGGDDVADVTFDSGGSVTEPTPPTRGGYIFLGWSETNGGATVNFPYSPGVSEDITLYALWSTDSYTVSFESNGSVVSTGSFDTDGTLDAPSDPTRTGYTFLGWSDTNGGSLISFPYAPGVSQDITLYALWSADSHNVTFESNGTVVSSGSFDTDGSLTAPSDPTRTGYTFLGWSATNGGSLISFPYAPGVSQDITLYAKWSVNSYLVSFDTKGGEAFPSTSFITGGYVDETFEAPYWGRPYRDGYTFLGWSATDGGSAITFPYYPGVTSNIILYALWSADSHSILFFANGSYVHYLSYLTDGSVAEPTPPTRAGYTFLGWSATDGGSAVSFPYAPGGTGSKTMFALWSADSHTVSFESNGNVFSTGSFDTAGTLDAPSSDPTRAGYTFLGWSATNGGSAITFPYSPRVTDDITLYALWSADSHNVSLESFGNVVSSSSFNTDGSLAEPTPPSLTGYTFLGWSATNGGSAITFPYSPGVIDDITLYALWSADSHNVTFESFGNPVDSGSFDTDGSVDEPTPPTLTGWTFLGWSATPGGSAVSFPYAPGVTEDITLYALWSADSHTVSFESNGTVVASGSFVTDGTLDAPSDPSRAGYTFLGWSATEGGSLISFPYHPFVTEDFTLYAVWSADSHNVNFESNGTVASSGSFDTDGTLDAPSDPTRTGYTFLGWSATNGGSAITFPYSPGVIDDITLYAKWSINTYVVIYNSKGGTTVASGSFVYLAEVGSAPRNPYRSGAIFIGWSATDGGNAVSFPYSPGVASDVTLYAKWTLLPPMLSTSSVTTVLPGDNLFIRISRVNEGCTVSVGWLQENTGVSSISKLIRADRTSGVFTIATPSTAGRYTLTTSTIGGECSNGAAVTLARAFTVGKKSSVVAKLSTSSTFVSRNPVVTVAGKVKTGSVAVVGREMTVSLRRNGVEVASATVNTDSSGAFVSSFSGITYLAGEYTTVVTGVADSTYLASEGVANKLTLR